MKSKKTRIITCSVLVVLLLLILPPGIFVLANINKAQLSDNSINPIYPVDKDWSVKDACMIYRDGYYYIFSSAFLNADGRIRCHIMGVKTADFKTFSEPLFLDYGKELGYIGLASPDIVYHNGTYYLTYNSWGDKKGVPNQLYYATSTDLNNWEFHKPLAKNLTEGIRAIDVAIAFYNNRVHLVYKEKQTTVFAYADHIDSNEWKFIPKKLKGWYENYQFINIDSQWYMMTTNRLHFPTLFSMKGDPALIESWTDWKLEYILLPPKQAFNTNERANAAAIQDLREVDGYFYMIYAGRTESRSHLRRGNNKLALIKSKDLISWETV